MKRLIFLLLFALPLFARSFEVIPVAPTTATPVSIRVIGDWGDSCAPGAPAIVRSGATIDVVLGTRAQVCPPTLNPWSRTIELGLLPPGQYSVRVAIAGETPSYVATKFVVREAQPALVIRPAAVRSDAPGAIQIFGASGSKVFIGDVQATLLATPGVLTVLGPSLPPGAYDVRVVDDAAGTSVTTRAAIAYTDIFAPIDRSIWEPVVYPLMLRTRGHFGTEWLTEAAIWNRGSIEVRPLNYPVAIGGPAKLPGENYPAGYVLLLPRGTVEQFSFNLRVRELSREADDYGAELPVARERDFAPSVALMRVPMRGSDRVKLRIYGLMDGSGSAEGFAANVTILRPPNEPLAFASVPLLGDLLRYRELDLDTIPELRDAGEVTVIVTGPHFLPVWAFASITNNRTQRVTIVSPQ